MENTLLFPVLADHAGDSPTDRDSAYAQHQQQQQQQPSSAEMVKSESSSSELGGAAVASSGATMSSTSAANIQAGATSGGGDRSPNADYMRSYTGNTATAVNSASPTDYQVSYGYYGGGNAAAAAAAAGGGAAAAAGGQYYGAQTGGSGAGAGGFNSPAMASLLYPHLYSAASMNPAALHLHGNGLTAEAGLTAASGEEYGLSAQADREAAALAAAAATDVSSAQYSHHGLEGDEGQTGPIRGAYSARSEHGSHVWRPY